MSLLKTKCQYFGAVGQFMFHDINESLIDESQECPRAVVIACGALAHEIVTLKRANQMDWLLITCLPAILHNYPDQIPEKLRAKIHDCREKYTDARILIAYADCGTGGVIDQIIQEEKLTRITGPHCYSFYAGESNFEKLMDDEVGSFFLTDYLAMQFNTLIIKGLGIDRFPELKEVYFANYKKLVYLAQTHNEMLQEKAEAAARELNLEYEYIFTGYGELQQFIMDIEPERMISTQTTTEK